MEAPNNLNDNHIHKPKSAGTILCSVCIATYRRPLLLEKLLRSLENQVLPEGIKLEVIVVDNDVEKSAEIVFQKFRNSAYFSFYHFNQPVKNISLARNLAVANASGDCILFVDDDEVASSRWVIHLLRTLEMYKADGVFGPVLPEFNQQTPDWMRRRELFYGPLQKTGEKAAFKWTGNCLIKASLLKEITEPFNPEYGTTGGEDTHLFDRLEQQGARFVFCQEACVSEFLPTSRTRLSSLFLLRMKFGNIHTRRMIEFAGTTHIRVRLFMMAKALILGAVSIILTVGHFPSSYRRNQWLMKLASNVGRFLAAFGWHYHSYR
jgi:succinoglycan biosynthesis protein ExoM